MDGWIKIGTKLETKSFEKQINEVEAKLNDVESTLAIDNKDGLFSTREIKDMEKEAEKLKNKLVDLKKKQTELDRADITQVQDSLGKISESTGGIVKKVLRWGLAVFSLRSAYEFVRQSVATLTEYDEQLANDIKYIQFAIATAIKPVIEKLVQVVYSFLGYVNAIAQAWFGVNLFANASADAMNRGAKASEKMKKSLTGFDEMNVISDTSSGGASGGGLPSQDLSIPQDKFEKAKNFWKEIHEFWEKDWENYLGMMEGNWGAFFDGVLITTKGFYDVFKSVIEIISGIWKMLVGLFQGDLDIIKEGWNKTLKGMKNLVVGVVEIVLGLLLTAGGIIKGVFLDLMGAIKNIIISIGNFFVGLWKGIVAGVIVVGTKIRSIFLGVVDFFKGIVSTILGLFVKIGVSVGNVIGSAFKGVINGVLWAIEHILNAPINAINGLIKAVNKLPGINMSRLRTFSLPRLKVGGIVNMPNQGVPVGSAIAGESGKEGVIPLTNSQAMAELGQAIGKYITINANITNTMNGRVISRELQQINSDSDFAFNR